MARPEIRSFTAKPNVITIREDQMNREATLEVLLEWDVDNVDNGDQVILRRILRQEERVIEDSKLSGSIKDKIPAFPDTVTYILTAKNQSGQPATQQLTVLVQVQK
jgi:hypothetical protein